MIPTGEGSSAAPAREVVVPDPQSMVRWSEHDFPHPLARWHVHPEVEIHLIRSGSGFGFVGESVTRFEPGHLVLVGSNVPHNWISDIPPGEIVRGRDVVLHLDRRRVATMAEIAPEVADVVRFLDRVTGGVEYRGGTARAASRELEMIGLARGLDRILHVLGLVRLLVEAPPEDRRVLSAGRGPVDVDDRTSAVVDATLRYITENLTGAPRLGEAAAAVGLSPSYLSRVFRRSTGVGFATLVRRLRVSAACELLARSRAPVAEICFRAGFSNLSNFNRQFRAEVGVTPSEYRTSMRAG